VRGLLYFAILVLALVALRPVLRRWAQRLPSRGPVRRDELVKDPVCQTYVLLSRAVKTEAEGVVTHFCSRECAERFARRERPG
jgi:YHS domain-containing protein